MTVEVRTTARERLAGVRMVTANNGIRSSFTVTAADRLMALDADLRPLGQWPLEQAARGCHSTWPPSGLALISGQDEVRMLDREGRVLWRREHAAWGPGGFESGCTWFDLAGRPHAVIPAPSYQGCLVIRMDPQSGTVLASELIDAAPAGIEPVHHADGVVGLSEGEGQDAVRAWWIQAPGSDPGHIGLADAGWDDWVLCDVNPPGTKIITTPHGTGPLLVRDFPSLRILRTVEPPGPELLWDFTACFAGDAIIARVRAASDEATDYLAAILADGTIRYLSDCAEGWLIPAAAGTWLTATRTTIRRSQLATE